MSGTEGPSRGDHPPSGDAHGPAPEAQESAGTSRDTSPGTSDQSRRLPVTPVPPPAPLPVEEVARQIDVDRRRVSLLGEIREVLFGAQDGLVSTLAVVAAVAGATDDRLTVVIAGIAAAVAGVFSMAIGEYVGSKSQQEVHRRHIAREWREVRHRRHEAEAEVAYLFTTEGMTEEDAWRVTRIIGRYPRSLLATMVSKELGIIHDEEGETTGSPLRGALVMGGSFALGALVPVAPFLLLDGLVALSVATVATGLVLFALGAIKTRWTHRSWWRSGLEVLVLATLAGTAGYLFGSVLPQLLAAAGIG